MVLPKLSLLQMYVMKLIRKEPHFSRTKIGDASLQLDVGGTLVTVATPRSTQILFTSDP